MLCTSFFLCHKTRSFEGALSQINQTKDFCFSYPFGSSSYFLKKSSGLFPLRLVLQDINIPIKE